jgi:outer membrane protein assembly factor BamB
MSVRSIHARDAVAHYHCNWCQLPDRVEAGAVYHPDIDAVLVGCYDGCLYALAAEDGDVLFAVRTGDVVKGAATVHPVTGDVFFGSYDKRVYHVRASELQGLVAHGKSSTRPATLRDSEDAASEHALAPHSLQLDGSISASVALAVGGVIAVSVEERGGGQAGPGSGNGGSGLGTVVTSAAFAASTASSVYCISVGERGLKPSIVWRTRVGGPVFGSPVLMFASAAGASVVQWCSLHHDSLRLLCTCADGKLYCLQAGTGATLWTHSTAAPLFSTILPLSAHCRLGDQSLVVFGGHDGVVRCLNVSTSAPSEQWACTVGSQVFGAMSPFGSDTVVVATTDGTIRVMTSCSGEVVAKATLPSHVFSSPVAASSVILVGCRDDFVYALGLQTQGQQTTDNHTNSNMPTTATTTTTTTL